MARREVYYLKSPEATGNIHTTALEITPAVDRRFTPQAIRDELQRAKRITDRVFQKPDSEIIETVISWFDTEPTDPLKADRLRKKTPHIEVVEFTNPTEHGLYREGTNFVAISHRVASDRVLLSHAICHELNHLGSFEIGKGGYDFGDRFYGFDAPVWLDEGLTEYANRRIVEQNMGEQLFGQIPTSYRNEIAIVAGIERIVGRVKLIIATRTKQFGEIADDLDTKIGEGFFGELLEGFDSAKRRLIEIGTGIDR